MQVLHRVEKADFLSMLSFPCLMETAFVAPRQEMDWWASELLRTEILFSSVFIASNNIVTQSELMFALT